MDYFNTLVRALHNFMQGTTTHVKFRDPKNEVIKIASAAEPTASPTPMPTPAPTGDPSFKYDMGESDYSNYRDQVNKALAGSPLQQYANEFIQAGSKHHVDPRVLISIANNESSLGKTYPTDSYNPFGYNARNGGMIQGPDGKMYVNVDKGLKSAGFTSLPMAIDRLTQRFSDHPVNATPQSYAAFRQNPTIDNLQAAYNASDAEKANYIKNLNAFVQRFKQ